MGLNDEIVSSCWTSLLSNGFTIWVDELNEPQSYMAVLWLSVKKVQVDLKIMTYQHENAYVVWWLPKGRIISSASQPLLAPLSRYLYKTISIRSKAIRTTVNANHSYQRYGNTWLKVVHYKDETIYGGYPIYLMPLETEYLERTWTYFAERTGKLSPSHT